MIDYERLDQLVDEDPIRLRDEAWREIREQRQLRSQALAEVAALRVVYRAAEAWAHDRPSTDGWILPASSEQISALIAAVDSYRSAAPTEPAPGDPRDTTERRDERAKWTKDIAAILRGLTADPDHAAYCKAADFLDPPGVPVDTEEADRGPA